MRCLQSVGPTVEGLGLPLWNNSVYVEIGIEKYYSKLMTVTDRGDRTNMVYFSPTDHDAIVKKEILDYGLEHKSNELLDYVGRPALIAEGNDKSKMTVYNRFIQVCHNLGDIFYNSKIEGINHTNTLVLLMTHGTCLKAIMEKYYGFEPNHIPNSSCTLLKINKEEVDDYSVEVLTQSINPILNK